MALVARVGLGHNFVQVRDGRREVAESVVRQFQRFQPCCGFPIGEEIRRANWDKMQRVFFLLDGSVVDRKAGAGKGAGGTECRAKWPH